MDIVDDLRDLNSMHTPKEASDIGEKAADEIERLREANKRLGEIATDAVGWMPPASVNGPREEYQNEIKELTDDQV